MPRLSHQLNSSPGLPQPASILQAECLDRNFGDAEGLWWDGNSKTGYRDAVLVQFSHLFGEGAHHGPRGNSPAK